MVRNVGMLLLGMAMLAGCSREVYLQPVPCEEECPECPCFIGADECCPETAMQTEVQSFQVYDVPAKATDYVPCEEEEERSNCRMVCRKVLKEAE